MKIESTGATHVGQKREGNEDSFLIDESLGLYIVCDGMGGHAAGEVASRRSIAYAAKYIRDRSRVIENASSVPGGYSRVVELVEAAVPFATPTFIDPPVLTKTAEQWGRLMYQNLADELCRNLLALQGDDASDNWLLETSEDVFGDAG